MKVVKLVPINTLNISVGDVVDRYGPMTLINYGSDVVKEGSSWTTPFPDGKSPIFAPGDFVVFTNGNLYLFKEYDTDKYWYIKCEELEQFLGCPPTITLLEGLYDVTMKAILGWDSHFTPKPEEKVMSLHDMLGQLQQKSAPKMKWTLSKDGVSYASSV